MDQTKEALPLVEQPQPNGNADLLKQAVADPVELARRLVEQADRKAEQDCLKEITETLNRHACDLAAFVPFLMPDGKQGTIPATIQVTKKK